MMLDIGGNTARGNNEGAADAFNSMGVAHSQTLCENDAPHTCTQDAR